MSNLIEKIKYDYNKESEKESEEVKKAINLDDMTPGARLRYEREQRNLSIQNVADHLYLESRVIKCLEDDEYDSLPQGIFIRGYIRNYAKYLEISSEPLIKKYREIIGEVEEISRSDSSQQQKQTKKTKQASSKDLWFKLLTFAIVIASFLLMALWRLNSNDSQTATKGENSAELTNGEESIQVPISFEEGDVPPSEESGTNPENTVENSTTSTTNTTAVTPTSPTNPVNTTTTTNANATTNTGTTAPSNTTNTNSAATTTNMTGQPPTPTTSSVIQGTEGTSLANQTVDGNTIKLLFDDSAWIAIYDSTEKELRSSVANKGEEITLKGKPPFKIKSAKLDYIRIEYKGQITALRNHPNRDGKWVTVGDVME